MKNFAIIINFEEKQCIKVKTKTRTRASSRFEAVCDVLSSAVDRGEVLGVAVGEWRSLLKKCSFA